MARRSSRISMTRLLSPCQSEYSQELCEAYRRALWAHSHLELNSRKTCLWNAAGEEPHGLSVRPSAGNRETAKPKLQNPTEQQFFE